MKRFVVFILLGAFTSSLISSCAGGNENYRQRGNAEKLDIFHHKKQVR